MNSVELFAKAFVAFLFGVMVTTPFAVPLAGPNLIRNGGFESGLTDWSTSNFFALKFDFGIDHQAHSGNNAFFGGALEDLGFLSQDVPTTAGRFYGINVWLASDGFLPNEFQIAANGAILLDRTDIFSQPYTLLGVIFLASAPTTTIRLGFRNDSGLLHVDDIAAGLAAPEPATLALLAIGFAGVSLARRRSA